MPLYEFKCDRCGHTIERIVSFSRVNDMAFWCDGPNCNGKCRMERQPSAPAFSVKGYNAANRYGVKRDK